MDREGALAPAANGQTIMTYAGLIELLERLKANAEEHGRHRDAIELGVAVKAMEGRRLLVPCAGCNELVEVGAMCSGCCAV